MLWHNGSISEETDHLLSPLDRGATLGDGLFETLPAFNGRAYLASAHVKRMMTSAAQLALPCDETQLLNALETLARADEAPASLRLTLTRGRGQRGLALPDPQHPTLFATRAAWSKELAFGRARLHTTAIRRNPTSITAAHKTLSYLDNVMAFDDARRHDADDGLMLDVHGHIASTSMANLFAVFGREILTPPLNGAVLPGIMRGRVIESATDTGMTIIEKPLHPRDLFAADQVFSTNSIRFMTKITAIDGMSLRDQKCTTTEMIEHALRDHVFSETGYRI